MKVNVSFGFSEQELRTIRAAHGRGGVATRAECRTFIDRAVRAALDKAPEPRPARVKRPPPALPTRHYHHCKVGHSWPCTGTDCPRDPTCPTCTAPEGTKERETIARLRRLYKLDGNNLSPPVV